MDILNLLDEGLEARGVFLDTSKAYNKVWHKGMIYKLQRSSVPDDLLNILIDFLNNRRQRVVFTGQSSNWAKVEVGVPQG